MKPWFIMLLFSCWITPEMTLAQAPPEPSTAADPQPRDGWTFPQRVGEFERQAASAPLNTEGGTFASYKDSLQNVMTVQVYDRQAGVAASSYQGAKAIIEKTLARIPAVLPMWEGPFRAGQSLPLLGEKIVYGSDTRPVDAHTYLYYFDLGARIVSVAGNIVSPDERLFERLDKFVRALPWDSLRLTHDACGSTCDMYRAVALHAFVAESFIVQNLQEKQPRIFPKSTAFAETCTAVKIAAELALQQAGLSERNAILLSEFSCAVTQRIKVKFFRMDMFGDLHSRICGGFYGMSCRGPIAFVAITDGKSSVLAHLQDGGEGFEVDTVARLLESLAMKGSLDLPSSFAKGNRDGSKLAVVGRRL
jgi:hypothetical protein